jgi:threonine/homoserine/homoserine lactone efflux protein
LKLAGAAYLIWLGAALMLAKRRDEAAAPPPEAKSGRRAFLEGIAVEALNPKTAIFFAAFLPQFIDPSASAPIWLQFLTLGTVVNLLFSTTDVICVLLAGAAVERLRRSARAQLWMRRAGGAAIVGLGVKLALQERWRRSPCRAPPPPFFFANRRLADAPESMRQVRSSA